jgi:hypothetical protein
MGIFTDPLPQGQPVGYTILTQPGNFHISAPPDGQYYLFTAALEDTQNLLNVLHGETSLHGSQGKYPIMIQGGVAIGQTNLCLTQSNWAEPPILTVSPCLLLSRYFQINPPST